MTAPPRVDRAADALRALLLETDVAPHAEGSCLVSTGRTRVLCTASVEAGVPDWRAASGAGWVTAEYAMLPRSTHRRTRRERGTVGGRTLEIQRLIGRALRATMDLVALGPHTITIDCDVLVADGGTRTAAICGGAVALHQASSWLVRNERNPQHAMRELVAATSVGSFAGQARLDLEYREDVAADVDVNIVALESGRLVEVQGTGEGDSFSRAELDAIVALGQRGIRQIIEQQRAALDLP